MYTISLWSTKEITEDVRSRVVILDPLSWFENFFSVRGLATDIYIKLFELAQVKM